MDRLGKIFKKTPKPSQSNLSLGIPTHIAVQPLGFRAELDIGPKGERDLLSRLRADQPDLAVAADENGTRTSRIVFHDDKSEDQGLPAPEAQTASTSVGGDQPGNNPTSECL